MIGLRLLGHILGPQRNQQIMQDVPGERFQMVQDQDDIPLRPQQEAFDERSEIPAGGMFGAVDAGGHLILAGQSLGDPARQLVEEAGVGRHAHLAEVEHDASVIGLLVDLLLEGFEDTRFARVMRPQQRRVAPFADADPQPFDRIFVLAGSRHQFLKPVCLSHSPSSFTLRRE